jgi:two-component system, chemotaxis family, sensor kinase Cph1
VDDTPNLSSDLLAEYEAISYEEEPIHIPGYIQDRGVLLVFSQPSLQILQVSENSDVYLGITPENLLERTLEGLFEENFIEKLRSNLSNDSLVEIAPMWLTFAPDIQPKHFIGHLYRQGETAILELEHFSSPEASNFTRFAQRTKAAISRLEQGADVFELCQIAVREIRQISGFDRVMVYRFDREGNGEVIVEAKHADLEPYLGLHYPAADIPPRARELFKRNALRLIPDVDRPPVNLVPRNNPLTNEPLDLSDTLLRGVSPIHIEYLQNMGVGGSMTLPLIKDRQLWGLVACHHRQEKVASYEARTACELLAKVLSLGLAVKEGDRTYEYRIDLKSTQTHLLESMSATMNLADGLLHDRPNLLNLFRSTGAAIWQNGTCESIGQTPTQKQIEALVEWISTHTTEKVFYTDTLSQAYADAKAYREIASGMLAIVLSKSPQTYLLWFRPEALQTVNWAGDPHKTMEREVSSQGQRWHPRRSFSLWQEIVRGRSFPWESYEVEAAIELRDAILEIVLKRADELAKLNERLQRSNQDLDAFAYIASHDLKEPLRGLHNYSHFLIEDYADRLDEEAVAKLETMIRLTQRMEDLLDSLLHYSRLDRTELSVRATNLNELVDRVLEMLAVRVEETGAEIRIPRSLPTVSCDRVWVGEVFGNLIANAIKYNNRSDKWVEIGFLDSTDPPVFYVRDNGIGIRAKHIDKVFQIFKRLHGPQQYGGGTGAGLTIAKKIVERHGGRIWVESQFEEGSTFYFTLSGES